MATRLYLIVVFQKIGSITHRYITNIYGPRIPTESFTFFQPLKKIIAYIKDAYYIV